MVRQKSHLMLEDDAPDASQSQDSQGIDITNVQLMLEQYRKAACKARLTGRISLALS